jgi:hypothetical protein
LKVLGFKYSDSVGRQLAPNFGDFLDLLSMMLSLSVAGKRLAFIGLFAVSLYKVHATPLHLSLRLIIREPGSTPLTSPARHGRW